ncbi:hypothetical protein EK0264_07655 [Epidermidibacterium keratini]|uniref:Nitrite/Sulfite reductase ferredoxin-like domain-containing protein n=1 Tax=Epidermidibacterium keratini TaxID=1891644 RepID=A0A7L4YLL5_9ACTN|nr:hypothetical protein [Epidermidibacterium keratini]QHC00161.1 hypothetical protein EK0264_07655 [Epidermidibacterium keratini]
MSRPVTDRCPGLVRPYQSADGALVRIRIPGGRITAVALAGLSALSEQYGDGLLQITSRANLQLRGITLADGAVDPGLAAGIEDLGLNPAPDHELVRNIAASPLSGLAGGVRDIRPLVSALDAGLIARPALAELPGRFLFAIDDGRGDQVGFDLGLIADGTGVRALVGDFIGEQYDDEGGVRRLLELAEEFVARRGEAWRVRELPEQGAELGEPLQPRAHPAPEPLTVGVHGTALVVMPRLGRLTPAQIAVLTGDQVTGVSTTARSLALPHCSTTDEGPPAAGGDFDGRSSLALLAAQSPDGGRSSGVVGGRAGRGTSPVVETTYAGREDLVPGVSTTARSLALPHCSTTDEGPPAAGGRAGRGTSPVVETTSAGRNARSTTEDGGEVVVTVGRQVVVTDPGPEAARALAAAGLESDPASPWTRITACTGAPGCANGQFETYPRAQQLAEQVGSGEYADGLPIHIAACDRLCGVPRGRHHLVTTGS